MRSTVVVGYDRSLPSGRALLEAGREAAYRGADVIVVHAYWRPAGLETPAREAAEACAAFGAAVLRRHRPALTVRAEAAIGAPHEVLAAAARRADLLVLGARGDGDPVGPDLESTTLRTLARTPCPTMVVRTPRRAPRGVVLAAIGLDDPTEEVLNLGFAEARLRSALLRVVSAYDLTEIGTALGDTTESHELRDGILAEAALELDRRVKERQDRCARVRVSCEVLDGPASAVLAATTARADLAVVGAHRTDGGRHGVRVGPLTRILLRHAGCPLVIVPRP